MFKEDKMWCFYHVITDYDVSAGTQKWHVLKMMNLDTGIN